jgi:Putative protein-S-isoprenylcysteine methyltransferase
MGNLNFLGSGPKIATVLLPWLTITIILSILYKGHFSYISDNTKPFHIAGILLLLFGVVFYASTVKLLLKGLKETKLVTNGAYYLCQNPLYSSILLFIIPSISLLMNSWLILTSSIAGYIIFKLAIKKEYIELEKFFGDEYIKYKNATPEFFPIPIKKWFR